MGTPHGRIIGHCANPARHIRYYLVSCCMRSIAVAHNPPPDVTTQHPQPPSLQEFWWNEQQVPQASWEKAFSDIPGYTLYTARRPGKGRSDGLGVLVKSTLVCEYAERIDLPMETGTPLPLHPSPPHPTNHSPKLLTCLPHTSFRQGLASVSAYAFATRRVGGSWWATCTYPFRRRPPAAICSRVTSSQSWRW